ncbi:MAG: N-acetylmuramoyl-L-alanine amidase [Clostridiales bacterium]|nr:N-acetylmuramoyl-L-alanine amidase [Clostridiales bacterium]
MRTAIFVLRKRALLWITLAAVTLGAATAGAIAATRAAATAQPSLGFTVVLDAGHGGFDGGVSGVATGTKESELNLLIVKKLRPYFERAGVRVVLTRTGSGGLYGVLKKNRKRVDMQARERIINDTRPALMVSIHQNFFSQNGQRGAQVFYKPKSEASKALGEAIRAVLALDLSHCDRILLPGDYYILNTADCPAVLVECGFLSNREEEALLLSDAYQEKLAYRIFLGCMRYLGAELPFG